MRFSAAVILASFSVLAQQAPPPTQLPRDIVRRPEPGGTAVIRGRVISSDTGNPIRRANVSLSAAPPPIQIGAPGGRGSASPPTATGGPVTVTTTTMQVTGGSVPPIQGATLISRPRQVVTDAQGTFEFTGLPAGSYRVSASPGQFSAQYVGMVYGAKRPNGPFAADPGLPIQLTDGQTFDKAVIALPRGAVIAGRVTDDNGEPLARVQVYTIAFPPGSARGLRTGSGAQTDDLGQFRLYGLQTGEFVVAAEARGNTFTPPNAPPETEEERIGFMTTYYPGTTDEEAAQRVRVRAGGETAGIEIRLGLGRLFHVSGIVTDSQGRALARGNGQLVRQAAGIIGMSSFFFSIDEQGRFQMRNIPAGSYRLSVRQSSPNDTGPGGPGAQADLEMANLPLTIAGADVDDVVVMTSLGTTITGQVVFEQGPPASVSSQVRVMATPGDPDGMMGSGLPTPQPASVTPDLTFRMKGLMGTYLLRASAPNQYIKAIAVNGEDVTDAPREFKSNDRIVVTLTSRASTVEGSVTGPGGAASTDTGIIIFSEDKALWRNNASRTKRSSVDPNGHFRIGGLMPGRYFIAAVPRERLNLPSGAANALFFEQLSKEATSVVVGEDEQRRVDLKVVEGGAS